MLPSVNINFSNGALGGVSPSDDNFFLLLFYNLSSAFDSQIITRSEDLASTIPSQVKEIVSDFYAQAGEGVRLAVKGVSTIVSNLAIGDVEDVLQNYSTISGIFFVNTNNEDDFNSSLLAEKMNSIATSLLSNYKIPVFAVGNACQGENDAVGNSTDLKGLGFTRSAICIGNFVASVEEGAASVGRSIIGLIAGRLAANDIQVKCSRVRDGAVTSQDLMMPSENIVGVSSAVSNEFYTKGYIVPRTITGKTGYYITDDVMCVADTNDYKFLAWRRTIDKAYRVSYNTLINHLNEEIPVTGEGYIVPAIAQAWQQEVISALYNTMTVNSQLSVDPTDDMDKGCDCLIDWKQKVVANSTVNVVVKVKPYGYAQFVNVELGFLIGG